MKAARGCECARPHRIWHVDRRRKHNDRTDGRYELHFGAASACRRVMPGFNVPHWCKLAGPFEANMNQHGNRSMASQELDEAELKNWHDKNPIILPGKPVELNFVMLPAARVIGKLVNENGQPLAKYSVALNGPDTPPGHSVLCSTHADDQGRFTLDNIPTTFRFQFVIRKNDPKPPWNDSWASAALRFDSPSRATRASFGDREIRLQELVLRVVGPGVHNHTATAVVANVERSTSRPERPTWLNKKTSCSRRSRPC